jgi:EAL domain-containing protein (putative c-di-GMP-specific phosphodiesterase class I)
MTHEVSRRSFTSESRVESQGILCGICDEQSRIRRNSSQVGRLSSDSIISLIHQSPFIHPLIDWFIHSFIHSFNRWRHITAAEHRIVI